MYAYILGSITAGITAFYSFRLISLVFLTVPNGNKQSYLNSHESKIATIIPLLILAIFSIFFGYVLSDLFVGIGSDFFQNAIFIHPNNISLVEAEFSLNPIFKLLPAILSISGATLAIYLYHIQPLFLINLTNYKLNRKIYAFLNGKYYFDVIYNHFFITNGLVLANTISKEIDRGAIELLGPYGLSNYFTKIGNNLAKLDTGVITTYSLYITLALIALLIIVFAPIFNNSIGMENSFNVISASAEEIRLFIIYIATTIVVLSSKNQN